MQRRLRRLRPRPRQTRCSLLRAGWAARPFAALRVCFVLSRNALLVILGGLLTASSSSVFATQGSGDIAEFIVNFARYTAWPADPGRRTIAVCYAHGGALAASAIQLEQPATVRGLPLTWRQVATPAQVTACDVLWLSADVKPAPREWLGAIVDKPVLTMSNYADFTADGGIVGAYRVGNDWRFEVSLEALQRARINIAAAALRLSQKPKPFVSGETR